MPYDGAKEDWVSGNALRVVRVKFSSELEIWHWNKILMPFLMYTKFGNWLSLLGRAKMLFLLLRVTVTSWGEEYAYYFTKTIVSRKKTQCTKISIIKRLFVQWWELWMYNFCDGFWKYSLRLVFFMFEVYVLSENGNFLHIYTMKNNYGWKNIENILYCCAVMCCVWNYG